MGQFSWCCAVCDQEVMHGPQPGYQKFTDAAIVWPNGDRRSGRYEDGYGEIGGIELGEEDGRWRLVHQSCFDPSLAPSALFAGFKPERHATDQGWRPSERVLVERYGEPDLSEFKEEQSYVCYECKTTFKAKWSGGVCPFGCVRPKNYRDSQKLIDRAANADDWATGDHQEMVEPFKWLDEELETADGVVICLNETVERPNWKLFHELKMKRGEVPPTKIEPCSYFGRPNQARVSKPEDWDEWNETGQPYAVRCRGCKSDKVVIVGLTHVGSVATGQ